MDPRHRDRIAFVRICSGKFTRDMTVTHARTGKTRPPLQRAQALRPGTRDRGRSLRRRRHRPRRAHRTSASATRSPTTRPSAIDEIPRFPPECFAFLHNPNPGEVQAIPPGPRAAPAGRRRPGLRAARRAPESPAARRRRPAAVRGRAVPPARANTAPIPRLENASWETFRWLPPGTDVKALKLPTGSRLAYDSAGQPGVLFPSAWTQRYFGEQNAGIRLLDLPPDAS